MQGPHTDQIFDGPRSYGRLKEVEEEVVVQPAFPRLFPAFNAFRKIGLRNGGGLTRGLRNGGAKRTAVSVICFSKLFPAPCLSRVG